MHPPLASFGVRAPFRPPYFALCRFPPKDLFSSEVVSDFSYLARDDRVALDLFGHFAASPKRYVDRRSVSFLNFSSAISCDGRRASRFFSPGRIPPYPLLSPGPRALLLVAVGSCCFCGGPSRILFVARGDSSRRLGASVSFDFTLRRVELIAVAVEGLFEPPRAFSPVAPSSCLAYDFACLSLSKLLVFPRYPSWEVLPFP